jgi:hypothetical protein
MPDLCNPVLRALRRRLIAKHLRNCRTSQRKRRAMQFQQLEARLLFASDLDQTGSSGSGYSSEYWSEASHASLTEYWSGQTLTDSGSESNSGVNSSTTVSSSLPLYDSTTFIVGSDTFESGAQPQPPISTTDSSTPTYYDPSTGFTFPVYPGLYPDAGGQPDPDPDRSDDEQHDPRPTLPVDELVQSLMSGFYGVHQDFTLSEFAHWPDAPEPYEPRIVMADPLPADLPVFDVPKLMEYTTTAHPVAQQQHEAAVNAAKALHSQQVQQAKAVFEAESAQIHRDHAAAIKAARSVQLWAVENFLPQSTEYLQTAVSLAEAALGAALDAARYAAAELLNAGSANAEATQQNLDKVAHEQFSNAKRSAEEASARTKSQLSKTLSDAEQQLSRGEITTQRFNEIAASVAAADSAETRRLAEQISLLQKDRDDALVSHGVAAQKSMADHQKAHDQTVALAGRDENQAVGVAKHALAVAEVANIFARNLVTLKSHVQFEHDRASADEIKRKALIDAAMRQSIAVRQADAKRDLALSQAALVLSLAGEQVAVDRIRGTHANDSSPSAVYQVAMAEARQAEGMLAAQATQARQADLIAAALQLHTSMLNTLAAKAKADATIDFARRQQLINAEDDFRTNYLQQLRIEADKSHEHLQTLTDRQQRADSSLDVNMAGVQHRRSSRTAEELEDNQRQVSYAHNRAEHNLLTPAELETELAARHEEHERIRTQVHLETFGQPRLPSAEQPEVSAEPDTAGGAEELTESGAKQVWLADRHRANHDFSNQIRKQNADLVSHGLALADIRNKKSAETVKTFVVSLEANEDAAVVEASSALLEWMRKAAEIEAEYQTATGAAAASRVADAGRAVAGFHNAIAQQRLGRIESHAQQHSSPATLQELAIAQATVVRTEQVSHAFQAYVQATADATSRVIAATAPIETTFFVNMAIANLTEETGLNQVQSEHVIALAEADRIGKETISQATTEHEKRTTLARVTTGGNQESYETTRSFGYFAIHLFRIHDFIRGMFFVNEPAYRALETVVGSFFAHRSLDETQSHLKAVAELDKELHDKQAEVRYAHATSQTESLTGTADRVLPITITAAQARAAATIAYVTAITPVATEHHARLVELDYEFQVATSAADVTFSQATTAARHTFNLGVLDAQIAAVTSWAQTQLDANGEMLPFARYSLDMLAARRERQEAIAPLLQQYSDLIDSRAHELFVETMAAYRDATLDSASAAAEYDLMITILDANLFATRSTLDARRRRDALVNSSQELAKHSVADYAFARKFADHRWQMQNTFADLTRNAEGSLIGPASQLHTQSITEDAYKSQKGLANKSYQIDTARARHQHDIALANAALQWWNESIHAHYHAAAEDTVQEASTRMAKATVIAETRHQAAEYAAIYDVATAGIESRLSAELTRASLAFDAAESTAWGTLVTDTGEVNIQYAIATAQAEATLHISEAQRVAARLVQELPTPLSPTHRLAVRVAQARTQLLRSLEQPFIAARETLATQNATAAAATAAAQATYVSSTSDAETTLSAALQAAYHSAASSFAYIDYQFQGGLSDDLRQWAHGTLTAHKTQLLALQSSFKDADTQLIASDITGFRSRSAHALQTMEARHPMLTGVEQPGDPAQPGGYLDAYNRDIALIDYAIDVAQASHKKTYSKSLAAKRQAHAQRIANVVYTAEAADQSALKLLNTQVADAAHDYMNSVSHAEHALERAQASIHHDQTVALVVLIKQILLRQYTEARNVYYSMRDLDSDPTVRLAIAMAEGAVAYATAILPEFERTQVTIAGANLTHDHTLSDQQLTFDLALSEELKNYRHSQSDGNATLATLLRAAWRNAADGNAAAKFTYEVSLAGLLKTHEVAAAAARRDARLSAGWQPPPPPSEEPPEPTPPQAPDPMKEILDSEKGSKAAQQFATAQLGLKQTYAAEMALHRHMAALGAASREFTFRSNVLGAWDA